MEIKLPMKCYTTEVNAADRKFIKHIQKLNVILLHNKLIFES